MEIVLEVSGLNLERMMTLAAQSGILLRRAKRLAGRRLQVSINVQQQKAFVDLCARHGWALHVVRKGSVLRVMHGLRHRPMIPVACLAFLGLLFVSSQMIWRIDIVQAGMAVGEVRSYLDEMGIGPGRLKAAFSVSQLRDALLLRLPDLAHVSVRYEGSTLVVDSQLSLYGEDGQTDGNGLDLIAAQDGVVTHMAVQSGTPVIRIGQAVRKGDVLVRGEERGGQQTVHPVQAQGEIIARVWSRGDARASRTRKRTVETGGYRRRVTLVSPWHQRVVKDVQPFASQDVSSEIQLVVGLYLPLYRKIETLAETVILTEQRSKADAASLAQGAAEQMAKNKCPPGAEILDKSVQYSMIDNEFVYAAVVLEYESSIAVHALEARTGL